MKIFNSVTGQYEENDVPQPDTNPYNTSLDSLNPLNDYLQSDKIDLPEFTTGSTSQDIERKKYLINKIKERANYKDFDLDAQQNPDKYPASELWKKDRKLFPDLEKQQALTTNTPDYGYPEVEKEVNRANEIADEAASLDKKISQDIPKESNKQEQYQQMLEQFSKLKPQEQAVVQDDLKKLQEEALSKSKMLNWFRIGDKVAQAYGERHGGKVEGMQDLYSSLEKQALQPVSDYKQLQQNQLDKLKIQLEQEQTDPNSSLAKQQRAIVSQLAKEAGITLPELDSMSAKALDQQMRSLSYILGNKRQAQESELNRQQRNQQFMLDFQRDEEARKNKKEQDLEKRNEKDVQKLEENIRSPQSMLTAFSEIENLLGGAIEDFEITKSGNLKKEGKELDLPGMNIPLIGKTSFYDRDARELDSAAYKIFNMTLKDRSGTAVTTPELERLKKEFNDGRFSTESELISGLQRYKRALYDEMNRRASAFRPEVVETFEDRSGLKLKNKEKTETKKINNDLNLKIESFMKKNGIKNKDEAIKILKEAGKI